MEIRRMCIDDYDRLYDLWIHTPGMGLNNLDGSREGIAAYLKRNPNTCFIAEAAGELAGVILAGHDGRRGFIYHTTVHPDYRRQGVGRCLVAHAVRALEEEGIHKLALAVFARNEGGNAFWEHMGFIRRDDIVYRNKNIHEMVRMDT